LGGGNSALLKAVDIVKRYDELLALNHFDVEIKSGEIVGLIGPNGAGKSTFINTVCGLIKPEQGKILFNGRNIVGLKPHDITRMGIVKTFQIPRVFANLTVLDNVVASASWFDSPVSSIREKALKSLELVNLVNKASSPASALSGGERKLLEFARSIALNPKLIMLDEPFAGVNPVIKNTLLNALHNVNEEGMTILIVSHDMTEIKRLCDRVIFMNAGKKLVEGSPEEVLKNPEVIKIYLGGAVVA